MRSRILEISSYPPPRAGWGVRVQFLKKYLEAQGHECVVLNIGTNRTVPSDEYETVLGGFDYLRKVWRFGRRGYVAHVHVNGASMKGFVLAIVAEMVSVVCGRRCFLTFHAGIEQRYFPRPRYPLLLPVFWLLFTLPRSIICNSEEVKARIVEYGVSPGKIVPIPAFSRQYLESDAEPLPAEVEAFFRRFQEIVFCYMKMRPLFFPELTIEAFGGLAARRPGVGLLLCGIIGHMDEGIWPAVQARLSAADLRDRVLVVDDLPHGAFVQALGRATVCLRTHLSDGVCSSVMEALSLGVPVVATENHTRPPGVITYDPRHPSVLTALLDDVLSRRDQIAAGLQRPDVRDTLAEEAQLLTA
ncbi:MAG: glycosyltransferase family 4 protein [Acidobacteria bacterium]|nr:glycosyltransferase family 4 protein [Acidobacteriota bacterium]